MIYIYIYSYTLYKYIYIHTEPDTSTFSKWSCSTTPIISSCLVRLEVLEDPLVKHAAEGNNAQAPKKRSENWSSKIVIWTLDNLDNLAFDNWILMKSVWSIWSCLTGILPFGYLWAVFFNALRIYSRVDAQCDAAEFMCIYIYIHTHTAHTFLCFHSLQQNLLDASHGMSCTKNCDLILLQVSRKGPASIVLWRSTGGCIICPFAGSLRAKLTWNIEMTGRCGEEMERSWKMYQCAPVFLFGGNHLVLRHSVRFCDSSIEICCTTRNSDRMNLLRKFSNYTCFWKHISSKSQFIDGESKNRSHEGHPWCDWWPTKCFDAYDYDGSFFKLRQVPNLELWCLETMMFGHFELKHWKVWHTGLVVARGLSKDHWSSPSEQAGESPKAWSLKVDRRCEHEYMSIYIYVISQYSSDF